MNDPATLVLGWSLTVAQLMLAAAMLCTLYRMLIGPRAQDRVLALDALYLIAMLTMLTLGLRHGSRLYFEAALIIALVGFVATAAFAKFLMRGEVIE